MPTAQLGERTALLIEGAEAEHFLQNILTVDLDRLESGEARPGALLSPQGKILFDFLISCHGENGFLLDCRSEQADDFMRRLMMYRLRSKVDIAVAKQILVFASWDNDSAPSQTDSGWLIDRRFASGVERYYGEAMETNASPEEFARLRIAHGIAESGADFAPSDAFPHDVLLDQNGGVGFQKGCYIGQEVVSRMQHRGTARRRVMIVSADTDLPEAGTAVLVGARTIGTLGGVSGPNGLAILRIDRVKAALDAGEEITAGGVALTASIPPWANYTLPQTAETGEA